MKSPGANERFSSGTVEVVCNSSGGGRGAPRPPWIPVKIIPKTKNITAIDFTRGHNIASRFKHFLNNQAFKSGYCYFRSCGIRTHAISGFDAMQDRFLT